MAGTGAELTTDELVDACQRVGLDVSETKLRHWRREGLLPLSIRGPGRGQGKGRGPANWGPSCVDRCRIIVDSLAEHPGSVKRAAEHLFAHGYWVWGQRTLRNPNSNDRVRDYLHKLVEQIEEALKKRRLFFVTESDHEEVDERLVKSVKRKNKGAPRHLLSIVVDAVVGVSGFASLHKDSPFAQLADCFKPRSILAGIHSFSDEELEALNESIAGKVRNLFIFSDLVFFNTLRLENQKASSTIQGPSLILQDGMQVQTYRTDSPIPAPGKERYLLRIIGLMTYVVIKAHEESLKSATQNAALSYLTLMIMNSSGAQRSQFERILAKLKSAATET